jgi:BirA family biotin operon repressor/biotin-[acetyl-CoA-carboxylase] ligase
VSALALLDLLGDLGFSPLVKWPNDILLGSKKVAGILIENGIRGHKLTHSVMGIGLNVNQVDFPVFPRPATSLRAEGGRVLDVELLASGLEACMLRRYDELKAGGRDRLEQEYLAGLYGLGMDLLFEVGGKQKKGRITGVDEYGQLLVAHGRETCSYAFQEIVFVD